MNAVWTWITGGISFLLVGLKLALAGMVGRVLATFGLTMVTFEAILPNLKAFIVSQIPSIPAKPLALLGALGVGTAMSMILSALVIRMAWKVFVIPTSVANSLGS